MRDSSSAMLLTYRVETPLLGIWTLDCDRLPLTIPVNAELSVQAVNGAMEEQTVVTARWNGRDLMVFAEDLQRKAALVRQTVE